MRADSPIIHDTEISSSERADAWFKIGGLALAALVPALFWTLVVGSVGRYFGFELSPSALAYTGSGIGLFLTAVCAPLIVNA